jgi:uncharacterized membrane protein
MASSTNPPPSRSGALVAIVHPNQAMGRLLVSAALGALATWLAPARIAWSVRAVLGWDVGALALIVASWVTIVRADAAQSERRASAYDPGHRMVWVIALAASLFSLFAATAVLGRLRGYPEPERQLWSVAALAAVLLSWALTHTSCTLRYAHLYYRAPARGGLEFPGGQLPCDFDFAYFSFTIGMCCQVSDVVISDPAIRRTVLVHAVLSFVYNTTILALALNLVFGHLG